MKRKVPFALWILRSRGRQFMKEIEKDEDKLESLMHPLLKRNCEGTRQIIKLRLKENNFRLDDIRTAIKILTKKI